MDMTWHYAASAESDLPVPLAAAGFTYIVLLIYIAIMGAVLASTGVVWHTAMQREKEQQLLFVGDRFRRALDQYSKYAQSGSGRFPAKLEDLLKDPRSLVTRRYLRKIYIDPITGTSNWGLVKDPNGEILGVFSLSENEPIKKHNFSVVDANFEDKLKYSDWVFMSRPVLYGAKSVKKL